MGDRDRLERLIGIAGMLKLMQKGRCSRRAPNLAFVFLTVRRGACSRVFRGDACIEHRNAVSAANKASI
jgi:hypothetical protein